MARKKIKILLIEDHAVVREGIRDLLQHQHDIEVVGEAADGEGAVRLAKRLKPDVVLMDIALPKVNGVEATRRIKESVPSVRVLVLTAYDNEEFIFAILEAGAAGYLLKEVRGRELIDGIRRVCKGESVLHPAITKKVVTKLQSQESSPKSNIRLSERELEVIKLGAGGLLNKEIASELSLSERTVQTHWRNIFHKLRIGTRIEAIMYCLRKGWISVAQDGENKQ